jgi:RNA ligase (TIGR02306 family)
MQEVNDHTARKLATIRTVKALKPISGADRIETAEVDGWEVVVKKGDFKKGDRAIYFEIDSFLPIRPEFEFLRPNSYKVDSSGIGGFRLRTIKLRGQISQGLLMPTNALESMHLDEMAPGTDITEMLGVKLYESPIPASLSGEVIGPMPSFIRKTDQERVQNVDLEEYKGTYEVTEKIDGTSATFYFKKNRIGLFGVCGRNWEYKPSTNNTYWRVARQHDLERKMTDRGESIAIQSEIAGEGIQGNPLKIKGQRAFTFNAWSIDKQQYLPPDDRLKLIQELGLESVPIVMYANVFECIDPGFQTFTTVRDLLKVANGKSLVNPMVNREGLVFKNLHDPNLSFKVIDNQLLLKEKQDM